MKYIPVILIIISTYTFGQEIEMDLNGFRLGQFREVPKKEFITAIDQDKDEYGFDSELYPVDKDKSVYMTFEYTKSNNKTIWSIELSGGKKGYDCSFKGLKLGMNEEELFNILDKPTTIESIGEKGHRWRYDNSNYFLELTPEGILRSVKIMNTSSLFYPEPDSAKMLDFEEYSKLMVSNDRNSLLELLAPQIKIYKNKKIYYFKKPMEKELKTDASGIFKLVNDFGKTIQGIKTSKYEKRERVSDPPELLLVAGFTVNDIYSEVVFKYMFGKYLITEMRIN